MKSGVKFLIIFVIAFLIGWLLIQYTPQGAGWYERMQSNLKSGILHLLDAEPKQIPDNSSIEQQTGDSISTGDESFLTGTVIQSGTGEVDAATIQKRLQYYQANKEEIRK